MNCSIREGGWEKGWKIGWEKRLHPLNAHVLVAGCVFHLLAKIDGGKTRGGWRKSAQREKLYRVRAPKKKHNNNIYGENSTQFPINLGKRQTYRLSAFSCKGFPRKCVVFHFWLRQRWKFVRLSSFSPVDDLHLIYFRWTHFSHALFSPLPLKVFAHLQ